MSAKTQIKSAGDSKRINSGTRKRRAVFHPAIISGLVAVAVLAVTAAGLAISVTSVRAKAAPYMVHVSVARKTSPISKDLYLTRPRLTEALARLANSLDAHLLYNVSPSGGASYIEISGSRIDLAGNWMIRVNGRVINDLSTVKLRRGDAIRLEPAV